MSSGGESISGTLGKKGVKPNCLSYDFRRLAYHAEEGTGLR